MKFWGVEVKAGQPLKVKPELGKLIHISQASLGEVTDVKAAKYVPLRLKIDEKNFVVGSLSAEDRTQLMFDLVFEREFEISHGGKTGSVFFLGYTAYEPSDDGEFSSDDFDSEDEPVDVNENGILKPTSADVKAIKAGIAKAGMKKNELSDDDEDGNESDSDSDADMALDGQPLEGSDDSEDDDEDDSSDEEELPKAQPSKKRPAEAKQTTPASKKAKSAVPDKSGTKGQTATPAPSQSAGKGKSKDQTLKSSGQETCKSCSKTFTSANALMAHSKAKHGGK